MTDGDAILAKILAEPDDDVHRLVYADWLDENGQSRLARFIRRQIAGDVVQVPLTHLTTLEPFLDCQPHQCYLRSEPGRCVVVPVGKGHRFSFCGGFVDAVEYYPPDETGVYSPAWLDHGSALLQCQPVRTVVLHGLPTCGRIYLAVAYQSNFVRKLGTWSGNARLPRTPYSATYAQRWEGIYSAAWPGVKFEFPDLDRVVRGMIPFGTTPPQVLDELMSSLISVDLHLLRGFVSDHFDRPLRPAPTE